MSRCCNRNCGVAITHGYRNLARFAGWDHVRQLHDTAEGRSKLEMGKRVACLQFRFTLADSRLAAPTIPHLRAVYSQLAMADILVPLLFGAGWGIAQVLFGISIVKLGLTLGYSIIVGLGALFGTLVPVLVQRREVLATSRGGLLLAGTAVMLMGVAVCGYAGHQREHAETAGTSPRRAGYAAALTLAILCGVLAPMVNFAIAFGDGVAQQAIRQRADPANAPFAVLALGAGRRPSSKRRIQHLSAYAPPELGSFRPCLAGRGL